MVSSRGVSAVVCVMVGLGCIISVMRGHRDDTGAIVTIADAGKPSPVETAPVPAVTPQPSAPLPRPAIVASEVDTTLPTGSIAPGSAVHLPNPAAYKDAPKMGDPVTVTGREAINYLAGNTLQREGPGDLPALTYFASRGLMGEGDERGFTAHRWDRDRPELCQSGRDGAPLCRSVSILLDGKYEYPGARLGTVTLGAAGGTPAVTAALVKGNALHFPEHIPFLDSTVEIVPGDEGPAGEKPKGGDPAEALVGRTVAAAADASAAHGRQIVYFAADNRRLELQQVQVGDGKAVQVTVGHWHIAKGILCQIRVTGAAPQSCSKVEAAANGLRLLPSAKAGEVQTLTLLSETGAREIAQD